MEIRDAPMYQEFMQIKAKYYEYENMHREAPSDLMFLPANLQAVVSNGDSPISWDSERRSFYLKFDCPRSYGKGGLLGNNLFKRPDKIVGLYIDPAKMTGRPLP